MTFTVPERQKEKKHAHREEREKSWRETGGERNSKMDKQRQRDKLRERESERQ